jgi:AraC-like DNA-binding protein
MTHRLNASELLSTALPHPHLIVPSTGCTPVDAFTRCYHPAIGSLRFKNVALPYMHIMDVRWDTVNAFELHDSTESDTIHINFVTDGNIYSNFQALSHSLDMRPKKHNLIYTPEQGNKTLCNANQSIAMLHISLEKDFFASVLGQTDRWSERIQSNLYHQRPFSAIREPQPITPRMLHLIDDIRTCKAHGPMRNLFVQSRVLELLALELEQFNTPVATNDDIRPDEADKLWNLKAYLDTNFLTDLNLTQLSRICSLNEFKVKKGFKQLFGTTVFNYVRKLRMEHAGRLLRNCALSVDEVADILGYEHTQHFSIAFRKYTGMAPSHYQRRKENSQPVIADC